ncbi:MAG: EFR1 family ferrodoxin [Clostridia bacterium]|nr:EFR1 family ferrodoxin [Clostridia bacterium]
MVLYFSATGNTEYIAQEIARRLEDDCLNLLDRVRQNDHSELHSDKPFVICAPVYVCEMPRFLSKYLREQQFSGSRDVYFIFTSGGYCGISGPLAKSMFRKKGMNYLGHAEFKMPRNYVISDSYPMLSPEEVTERIHEARRMLDPVADDIRAGRRLKARHVYFFEKVITVPFNPIWCRYKMPARDFYTTEACVGCGKCARLCPLNNITMKDKKPVWGDRCTHCMACIGNCPTRGIEYGTITLSKQPYRFGQYRRVAEEPLD